MLMFQNAAFKNMLDIASRANPNRGYRLPSPKQSRARIITMFKQQMVSLRDRLTVRPLSFVSLLTDIFWIGTHCGR